MHHASCRPGAPFLHRTRFTSHAVHRLALRDLYPHDADIKKIRIHDIRHSHVSLLINNGFTAIAVAARVGHKHISTTMNVYSHLFPNRQTLLVDALEDIHNHYGSEESSCQN